MVKDEEIRNAHPGWAVKFENGTWLSIAHGVDMATDAFYANTYETKEEATLTATSCYGDGDIPNTIGFEVIPAWEPLCERLRHDVRELTTLNTLSSEDVMEMTLEIESVLYRLRNGIK